MGAEAAAQVQAKIAEAAAHHRAQRLGEAEAALAEARRIDPSDPLAAFLYAQTRYELGHAAATLFAEARSLWPDNRDALRNHALALISEGEAEQAETVLRDALLAEPGWFDGLKALATLRWTRGDREAFAEPYPAACRSQPGNPELWLAWFRTVAQARDWDAARSVIAEAERHLGQTPALLACRLFVAVEAHDDPSAEELMVQTAHIRGDVTSLCRIRHALRRGEPQRALDEALPLVTGTSAALYWPYISLAWRLLGDPAWHWLDRPEDLIRCVDTSISGVDLAELARLLRGLHTAQAPYLEQSVRGGTQTDRSVLLRHEPQLQCLRQRLIAAVRDYVSALPPVDPRHPLLARPRGGDLLIEGSWSVRLMPQGHNVPHTHAMGWLSTAFYVAVPNDDLLGPAPAGHIAFGIPPPELGLPLEPYRAVAPEPGRLVIFPSTTWHGTIPFAAGERLIVSFDVKPPHLNRPN